MYQLYEKQMIRMVLIYLFFTILKFETLILGRIIFSGIKPINTPRFNIKKQKNCFDSIGLVLKSDNYTTKHHIDIEPGTIIAFSLCERFKS